MLNLAVLSLILAIGASVAALAFYGRAREGTPECDGGAKWAMLFATWRDSMIITALYVAQGFVYRFGELSSFDMSIGGSVLLYAPVVMPVLLFVSDILIFSVAILRIVALTRFLGRMTNRT